MAFCFAGLREDYREAEQWGGGLGLGGGLQWLNKGVGCWDQARGEGGYRGWTRGLVVKAQGLDDIGVGKGVRGEAKVGYGMGKRGGG